MVEKSLTKNALFNVIYKSLNVLFPLVTMIYVSRVLLPEGVGKVASAQNITTYFVIIASLGLPTYGVKNIAEFRDDRKKCSKVFSELFAINAISTILCSFFYVMMLLSVGFFHTKIAISLVVGIQLFANIINIDWLYQGFEEYRYIMFRSLFVKLMALVSVFFFVHESSDYIIYALITAISLVANFAFNIAHMHKFVDITFRDLYIKAHLKPIFTLLAASIAIEIYTLAATTFLSVLKGDEIVGYFTNSVKAVSITRTMIAAVCAVFLPRLNYYIGQNRIEDFNNLAVKGLKVLLTMSVPACIALAVMADELVFILFGSAFEPSVLSMRILSISVITVAISNFMGYQILVSLGKERVVLYSTIIGALVNVMLNIVLINTYSHYGASVASVITEGIISIYQLYYVSKLVPLKADLAGVMSITLPAISILIIMIPIKIVVDNLYVEVILTALFGFATYIIAGVYCRNEAVTMILSKVLRKKQLK